MISVYLLLDFDPSRKLHPDSRAPMPVGESGSRHDRLWEQTRPPLGRDANVSGAAFAEKQWVWSGRQSPSFARICYMGQKKVMVLSVIT